MGKQINSKDFNDLVGFFTLVTDSSLDRIFYPPDEYFSDNQHIGASLLTGGPHCHPLHPEFKPVLRNKLTFAFYGLSVDKYSQPVNLDKNKEELFKVQKIRVDAHWRKVRSHRFYKEISRHAGFKKSIDCLKRKIRSKKDRGYSHPYAEFRFIGMAVEQLVFFMSNGRKAVPEATAADKRAAMAHIKKIEVDLYQKGIKFKKSSQLLRLLNELRQEIEGSKSVRAERSDENSKPYRDLTYRICDRLLRHFGEVSKTLLHHLVSIVEPEVTNKTISNRIKKHSKRQIT